MFDGTLVLSMMHSQRVQQRHYSLYAPWVVMWPVVNVYHISVNYHIVAHFHNFVNYQNSANNVRLALVLVTIDLMIVQHFWMAVAELRTILNSN